jgi:hypothetical protein
MFRSLRTGEVIDERWLRFSFPTFWHYDVLPGLEYLRKSWIASVDTFTVTVLARKHIPDADVTARYSAACRFR